MSRYLNLTQRETEVLGLVATGDSCPRGAWKTLKRLEEKGFIEQVGRRVVGTDRFGDITVPVFDVPLPQHMAWCKWASGQVGNGATS